MRTQTSHARLISSLLLLLILISTSLLTGCVGRGSLSAANEDPNTQSDDSGEGDVTDDGADEYADLDSEYFQTGNDYGNNGGGNFQQNQQLSNSQQACFGGFNSMFQGGQYSGQQNWDDYGARNLNEQGNYCLDPRLTGTTQSLTRSQFYDVGDGYNDRNLGCLLRALAFRPRSDVESLYGIIGVIECISQHSVGYIRQELPWTTDQYGYFDRTQYNLNVFAHILR